MDFDIIVIGSASMDVFVKTEARIVHIQGISHGQRVDEQLLAYPLGSKLLIEQLTFAPGGAGTNACATFARLGFKTALIGKIGVDVHGQMLLDWLEDNAITFLGERGGQTGYSLILASQASDRTILSFKGCNNELESVWPASTPLPTRWLYGTSMLEQSFQAQERLFVRAKQQGIRTVYNPNPYLCYKGMAHLGTMLRHSDVLILNTEEAGLLVGGGAEPLQLAAKLAGHGPGIVTISDGAGGVTVWGGDDWGGGCWHIEPADDLKIVDTTGAGDAFGSGFIAGLHLNKTLPEAALMGVLNAEDVIQAYGPKGELVSRERMEARLLAEKKAPRHEVVRL